MENSSRREAGDEPETLPGGSLQPASRGRAGRVIATGPECPEAEFVLSTKEKEAGFQNPPPAWEKPLKPNQALITTAGGLPRLVPQFQQVSRHGPLVTTPLCPHTITHGVDVMESGQYSPSLSPRRRDLESTPCSARGLLGYPGAVSAVYAASAL